MTKGQCAEKLRDMGYDAFIDNFAVMIRVDTIPIKNEQKKIKKILQDLGYHASYGFRVRGEEDADRK